MDNIVNACIEFENGKKINLELYKEIAPLSVENFVTLAKEGFYNGLCFHRVIPNFMIQGGGFIADDSGAIKAKESKKTIKGEFRANGVENTLSHAEGVISMARTPMPDSASSQFFICVDSVPYLDGQYAAFGKTIDRDSLEVAKAISKVKTTSYRGYDDVPVQPVVIKKITIIE